jgi:hypothetical protein
VAFDKYEETEDTIDWDWIEKQPLWARNAVKKGKLKPKLKKRIRKEKRNAEKKHRN